ncbi:MAG: hypothetical protein RIR79_1511 [Pseudomonadota bacterium]|jgi:hypothetical protein
MVTTSELSNLTPRQRFARAIRVRFLADLERGLNEVGDAVQDRFSALIGEPGSVKEIQDRREAWAIYRRKRSTWLDSTSSTWRDCLNLPHKSQTQEEKPDMATLQLVKMEVVESKILVSRLVMSVMDKVAAPMEDMRIRLQFLEGTTELADRDVIRPEVLISFLIDEWSNSGMPTHTWAWVSEAVKNALLSRLQMAYANANEVMVKKGVLPTIDLKDRLRGTARFPSSVPPSVGVATSPAPTSGGGMFPENPALNHDSGNGGAGGAYHGANLSAYASLSPTESARMAAAPPVMARAYVRAQGTLGQVRKMLGGYVQPSPALSAALAEPVPPVPEEETFYVDYSPAGMVRVADALRDKTVDLKKKASSKNEKAVIEIVALMFQAILAEDRIPPGIRVWFSRLQMPVLRLALTDVDFLNTTTHPARLLIDRMGSCVMGFDATGVESKEMEIEIKRIVQVIEQYPETGKKVFQVVYEEFEKFLSRFLTDKSNTSQVVSVAQQVEQKETLTIQYTIEMRTMLKDMPVRDEIRDFLFKVWAEVLAVATVRKGAQHKETLLLKKTAPDLVWSASAKPNRADRAKVIQELPTLLQRLRSGMELLSLPNAEQDQRIKVVSDTLSDAFLSKTQLIPQEQIDAMAERLGNLEDFVNDDGSVDLPLDPENIEMVLGIDTSSLEVIANGDAKPAQAILAWAHQLQVGAWFTLNHKKQIVQVQFVWRSERKHLNLFSAPSGKNFLIQAGRLAVYLQAGLLLPQEEDALTIRATRDALSKIEANPERLT